jgi:hypothetical protein
MATEIIQCLTCLGEGQIFNGNDVQQCLDCNGSGKVEAYYDEDNDEFPDDEEIGNDIELLIGDPNELLMDDPNIIPFDENKHTPLND